MDATEELETIEDGAEEPLELQYAIHVCAGPAYIMDPEYDDFQLAKQCASEYIGQDLGYLVGDGPDRHYKPYPVDSIYIMDNTGSEDPVWSWYAPPKPKMGL